MNAVLQKVACVPNKIGNLLERRKWVLPSFLSFVLFALAIWGIGDFNQLLLYDDEFGYWMASAYLTGTDWKSVGSEIPYYSYGYGFLILTPIRLIFSSPATMYRAAIVVNGLLLVGSYWIARNVAHQLFEDANQMLIDVVCFVVMLYPSNLTFSHIAWAECTLVFVFWVFVWLSLRVIKKPSVLNHIGIAAVVMYLYVVHQRTLGVAIATVMVMVWCFCVDKSRRKSIIVFAVTMVGLMVVHKLIKTDLLNEYYFNNLKVDRNNMGGQIDKLANILTGEGLLNLLASIVGKLFYFAVGTVMMMWWCAEFLVKNAVSYFEKSFNKKQKRIAENLSSTVSIWYFWLLLAFAGTFLISAIFLMDVSRNDVLLYGRYVEYMIGIYFLIGIMMFLKDGKWLSKTVVYFFVVFAGAWFSQNVLDKCGLTSYQAYHSICTSLFLKKGVSADGAVWEYAVFGFVFSIFVMLLIKAEPWKKHDFARKAIAILSVVCLFVHTAYGLVFSTVTEKQLLRIVNIQNVVSWIDVVDNDMSQNVYYLSNTESRYWSESFQFLLAEKPLTVIHSDEVDLSEDAFYLVGNGFLDWEGFDDHFYCIKESNQFALVVNKYGELAQTAREIKGE